jgi:hypothetical protein
VKRESVSIGTSLPRLQDPFENHFEEAVKEKEA